MIQSVLKRLGGALGSYLIMMTVMVGFAIAGPVNVDSNGVALEGHDPIAYFTEGKPVQGSDAHKATHEGAIYYFANAENLAAFTADPGKYAPQYGGYCAYGLAYGSKAPVEIDKFTIVDGKLYLNFDGNIQSEWEKDITGFVAKADRNWVSIK